MLGRLIMLAIIVAVSGCATQGLRLTVTSQPEGAYITSVKGGTVSGIAPVVGFWAKETLEMSTSRDASGCHLLGGFTARWVSGAVTEVPVIRHCGELTGNYNFVIPRDMNYPDLGKDLQFVLQLQANQAQAAQAKAAGSAADAAMWSAATSAQKAAKPVICSTYTSGRNIQTICK